MLPFLALRCKWCLLKSGSVPLTSPWGILLHMCPLGPMWTLSFLCLHCVHCSDLWPLCLCWQITSEVHLFSHTKGKRHQQAVRDSSSIQGRELSDEEVVRTPFAPSLSMSITLTHNRNKHPLPPCCSWCVKRERDTTLVFYDAVIIIVHATLFTTTALLEALFNCKWALKCTQLWFNASAEGWQHPLDSRLFCHEVPFHRKAAR